MNRVDARITIAADESMTSLLKGLADIERFGIDRFLDETLNGFNRFGQIIVAAEHVPMDRRGGYLMLASCARVGLAELVRRYREGSGAIEPGCSGAPLATPDSPGTEGRP